MMKIVNMIIVFSCILILTVLGPTSFVTAERDELSSKDHADSIAHGAPLIDTTDDVVILELGDTWNVTCRSQQPIIWIPYAAAYIWDPPITTYNVSLTEGSNMSYGAVLTIEDATAAVVGRYYCVNKAIYDEKNKNELDEIVAEDNASTLYVYVNDTQQPLVPIHYKYLNANQYDSLVIPCKPSHPATEVKLYNRWYEEVVDEYEYSSAEGYRLSSNRNTNITSYYCRSSFNILYWKWFEITVNEQSGVDYLPKPSIHTKDHVPLGKPIRMSCSIELTLGEAFTMEWKVPPNYQTAAKNARIKMGQLIVKKNLERPHRVMASQELIIDAATLKDQGTYRCEVSDHMNHTAYHNFKLHVWETSNDYVVLNVEDGRKMINAKHFSESVARPIDIVIHYRSYSTNISYYWTKDNRQEQYRTSKYKFIQTDKYLKLTINDPTVYDTGNYTLVAMAGSALSKYTMPVYVYGKPIVNLDQSKYIKPGKTVDFKCRSVGYPLPTVEFLFQPCLDVPWQNCSTIEAKLVLWDVASSQMESLIASSRTYKITTAQPGIVYCKTTNSEGSDTEQVDLLVSDLTDPLVLEQEDPRQNVTVGDTVTYVCLALVYNYTKEIKFNHNGKELHDNDGVQVIYSAKLFAWEARMKIDRLEPEHSGKLTCLVKTIGGSIESKTINIEVVIEPKAPWLLSGVEQLGMIVDTRSTVVFYCDVAGTPDPEVIWFKDGKPLKLEGNSSRIHLNRTVLTYEYLNPNEFGLFECTAINKEGNISKSWNVDVRSKLSRHEAPADNLSSVISATVTLLVLLCLCIVLISMFCYKKNQKMVMRNTHVSSLHIYEEPNLSCNNPYIVFDEQVDIPSNNSEYDLSCYNPDIALDEQVDILSNHSEYEFPRDQLKLGEKLGAGAFGVVKKATAIGIKEDEHETTVAVKMVKKETDNEIMRTLISELKIMSRLGQHLNVVNLLGAVTKNIDEYGLMIIVEYCPFGNLENILKENRAYFIDQINQISDEINQTIETIDRPNAPQRSSKCNRSIKRTDLVCWAAQIAAGMEYVGSQNVLHGDLATRNILLCEENVVKICDFDLSRTLLNKYNYEKTDEAPLPLRWLALECFNENKFSTYSDVWAYGIVLWELFSLGEVPYPGIKTREELLNQLVNGYRMDKPPFSNQAIYYVMLNCWNVKRNTRPSFKDLKIRFHAMLQDETRNHYLQLNEPYLRINAERMERRRSSYMGSLTSPKEKAPPVPNQQHVSETGASELQQEPPIPSRNKSNICLPSGSKTRVKLSKEIPTSYIDSPSSVTIGHCDEEKKIITLKLREHTSEYTPEPANINKVSNIVGKQSIGRSDEITKGTGDVINKCENTTKTTINENRKGFGSNLLPSLRNIKERLSAIVPEKRRDHLLDCNLLQSSSALDESMEELDENETRERRK